MKSKRSFGDFIGRWYLPFTLSLWFLMPEVRRLIDWQIGPNSISILSVIPLLFLAPLVVPVMRNVTAREITLPYRIICYSWLFAFVYALVVAFAAGGRLDAVFQFLEFCLPFVCGAWVVTRRASREETFREVTNTFLWVGAVVGAYGIYQYVAPPPWDVAWVNNSGLTSIGLAEPFGLRVFSTLNSPSTAAFFFVFVALLGLHKLDLRRPGPALSVTICVAALALTSVRAAWLALAVGVVVFFLVSPKRGRPLVAAVAVAAVFIALFLNASTLMGSPDVTAVFLARLDTLSDVDSDYSAMDRRRETAEAAHEAFTEPLGQGLGTVGTSTKLGGGGQLTLDNGYMSRFVEMGVAGFGAYLVAIGGGLIFAIRALRLSDARKDLVFQQIAATAITIQVALLGLELSVDAHAALPGLVFWLLLGLTLRQEGRDTEPSVLSSGSGPAPTSPGPHAPLWA
jgi:putative inorganic carbon (HCO3(-)) transporter